MLVTEFDSRSVDPPQRFGAWKELVDASHMRHGRSSAHQDDYRARLRLLSLGDVQIAGIAQPHMRASRTPRQVRQSDPQVYNVLLLLEGRGYHAQAGRETHIRPGQFVVVDSSRPMTGELHATAGTWSTIVTRLPRARLPLPDTAMRDLLAVPIPARHGVAGLLRDWLTGLHARAHDVTPDQAGTLASTTTELVAATLARHLEAGGAAPAPDPRRTLELRVHAFIEQHLADPGLTPEAVAAAHGISARHLHRLFRDHDRTVAAWIRHRRLERCLRDLADPAQAARPVHAVAARWGFTDPAHFARVFRAAYGSTAGEYRRRALREGPPGGQAVRPPHPSAPF